MWLAGTSREGLGCYVHLYPSGLLQRSSTAAVSQLFYRTSKDLDLLPGWWSVPAILGHGSEVSCDITPITQQFTMGQNLSLEQLFPNLNIWVVAWWG